MAYHLVALGLTRPGASLIGEAKQVLNRRTERLGKESSDNGARRECQRARSP